MAVDTYGSRLRFARSCLLCPLQVRASVRTRTMVTPGCGWSPPVASRPLPLGDPGGSRYRRTSQEDSMQVTQPSTVSTIDAARGSRRAATMRFGVLAATGLALAAL